MEIRDYLSGNLCRCGTYSAVIAAIQSVVGQVPAETENSRPAAH